MPGLRRAGVSERCPSCGAIIPSAPLTPRQRECWLFIVEYIDAHGVSPTYQQIGEALGGRGLTTVFGHVHQLEAKGFLQVTWGAPRGIQVLRLPAARS